MSEPIQASIPTSAPMNSGTPEPTVPTVTPPADPPKPSQDDLQQRFAAMAKREKQVQRQQMAVKAEADKMRNYQARVQQYDQWAKQARENPMHLLQGLGWTPEKISQFILNDQKPTPDMQIDRVQQELNAFRAQQEQVMRKMQDDQLKAQAQEADHVISSFKDEIRSFVDGKGEEFEYIKHNEDYEMVYDTIDQHFAKTGKELPLPAAAKLVEEFLEEEASKIAAVNKFKAKFGQPKKEEKAPSQTSSLSNHMTQSSAPSLLSPKTEADRIQRALAALDKR